MIRAGRGPAEAGESCQRPGDRAHGNEQERERAAARDPPPPLGAAVEAAFQRGDQPADPGDRVADRPVERVRIAGRRLDPEGDGEKGERVGRMDHSVWSVPARDGAAIVHGGDLGGLRRAFPDAPEPWLDLSTGINPVPYRVPPVEASAWMRLPEAAEVRALRDAAAAAYGAPDAAHVVPAPGTQILIETLPRLVAPTRVAVLGPTYAEHAAAWARAGHAVAEVRARGDRRRPGGGASSIPTTRTGGPTRSPSAAPWPSRCAPAAACWSPTRPSPTWSRWRACARTSPPRASRRGSWCCAPSAKPTGSPACAWASRSRIPGRRAGSPRRSAPGRYRVRPWRSGGQPWPMRAWRAEAARARGADAGRLDRLIVRGGGRIVGGTSLFRTADFADGPGLYRRLAEAGIAVRRFAERPERLRFGLPAGKAAWCRLSRVLR